MTTDRKDEQERLCKAAANLIIEYVLLYARLGLRPPWGRT